MFVKGMRVYCHNPDDEVPQYKGLTGIVERVDNDGKNVRVIWDKEGVKPFTMYDREIQPIDVENE